MAAERRVTILLLEQSNRVNLLIKKIQDQKRLFHFMAARELLEPTQLLEPISRLHEDSKNQN